MQRRDYKALAASALASIDRVVGRWLPDGKRDGAEYVARNPTRNDQQKGSFSVNLASGVWADFATGDKGGDLISLVAYIEGTKNGPAADMLADFLGLADLPAAPQAAPSTAPERQDSSSKFVAVMPAPEHALSSCPTRHPKLGKPSASWDYLSATGALMMRVLRFEQDGGRGKEFRPLCYGNASGRLAWHWRQPDSERPLYGLSALAARPTAPVLLCEGEKAADAARSLFPDSVVMAWPGGSKAIGKVAFEPLAGKEVCYWPDNDKAGRDSISPLHAALEYVGCASFAVLNISLLDQWQPGKGSAELVSAAMIWPEKADAADAVLYGWTAAHFIELRKKGEVFLSCFPAGHKGEQPAVNAAATTANTSHGRAPYRVDDDGVFWMDHKSERWRRLSDRIDVVAESRTAEGRDWGLLVRFRDRDHKQREWNIPRGDFASEGSTDVIRHLLSLGLRIEPQRYVKRQLIEYLAGAAKNERVTLVNKMGWHGSVFMLPNQVIGESTEAYHYYSDSPAACKAKSSGTLKEWQDTVASYAEGNHLLMFAISAALSAPLLEIMGSESFGFHFVGDSSLGKSTLLKVAASVFGPPDEYPRTWRATDNALEATAAAHSDCLLVLDEIGQCDPRIIGETVYMLGNGQGKARANDRGGAKEIQHRWRLVFLSSGERTLLDHMADAGKRPQAGMEMRLLTMPACLHGDETNRKRLGIYQNSHEFSGGADLSDALVRNAGKAYGVAAVEFLSLMLAGPDPLRTPFDFVTAFMRYFDSDVLTDSASGQAKRASAKFALVAAAGELATTMGVTGWRQGAAAEACKACFRAWLNYRGGEGSHEEREILEQVRHLIGAYGESRFTRWDSEDAKTDDHAPRTLERWGFKRTEQISSMLDGISTESKYYVFPEAFRQHLAKGFDPKRVAAVLADNGVIECNESDRAQQRFQAKARLPGLGTSQKRCYILRGANLYPDAA